MNGTKWSELGTDCSPLHLLSWLCFRVYIQNSTLKQRAIIANFKLTSLCRTIIWISKLMFGFQFYCYSAHCFLMLYPNFRYTNLLCFFSSDTEINNVGKLRTKVLSTRCWGHANKVPPSHPAHYFHSPPQPPPHLNWTFSAPAKLIKYLCFLAREVRQISH